MLIRGNHIATFYVILFAAGVSAGIFLHKTNINNDIDRLID